MVSDSFKIPTESSKSWNNENFKFCKNFKVSFTSKRDLGPKMGIFSSKMKIISFNWYSEFTKNRSRTWFLILHPSRIPF